MRGVPLLSLFICLLTAVYGQKLSESENLERYQSCGKYSNETAKEVPWVMGVHHPSVSQSGFAISSRHFVTSTRIYTMYDSNKNQWDWFPSNTAIDWTTCKDGIMPMPPPGTFSAFHTDACGFNNLCQLTGLEDKLKRGVFIGKCDETTYPYGFIVLELESDFPKNESISPVCLDENVVANVGDKVDLYSFLDYTTSVKRQEHTVEDCGDRKFSDESVCVKSSGSYDEKGGAYVKNIGGRMTTVAVAHYYEWKANDTVHTHISINKYLPQICEFTGVCQPRPPTTTTTPPPPPPITDKITEEKDQESGEESNENTGSENGSTGTQTVLLSGVLALLVYLY